MTKPKSKAPRVDKKVWSITVMCIICVIALFFGVVSFLPDGLAYGDYNEYHAPVNLIQKSGIMGTSTVATYKVKLDEGAKVDDVISTIRARLANMYGYYFCQVKDVSKDGNVIISVRVPKTADSTNSSAESILKTISQTGKAELLAEQSYSESSVLMELNCVRRAKNRSYVYGDQTWYLSNLVLTKSGKKLAASALEESDTPTYYLYIDGQIIAAVAYTTKGEISIYSSSKEQRAQIAGIVKSGPLSATLTLDETTEVKSCGGLVFLGILAALVVGTWIFYSIRYKSLSFAPILAQLVAVVVFVIFAGLAYFSLLNIAAAIGIVLGFCLMSCFTIFVMDKMIKLLGEDKTFASARFRAFSENNKWNLIVHGAALLLSIVLWLIPTGVTAPLGNALLYCVVLSFVVTMGLNRLFTWFLSWVSFRKAQPKDAAGK